jgi:hypothetical protein
MAHPDARQDAAHSGAGTLRAPDDRFTQRPEGCRCVVCRGPSQAGTRGGGGAGPCRNHPGEAPAFRHDLPAGRGHARGQAFKPG